VKRNKTVITAALAVCLVLALFAGCGAKPKKVIDVTRISSYPDEGDYVSVANDALQQYCDEKGIKFYAANFHPHGASDDYWYGLTESQIAIVRAYYWYTCSQFAAQNPDIRFISIGECDMVSRGMWDACQNDNVLHITGDNVQKAYISGYLAATASKTGEVAMYTELVPEVGYEDRVAEDHRTKKGGLGTFIASYVAGAKAADPDVKVYVFSSLWDMRNNDTIQQILKPMFANTKVDVISTYSSQEACDLLISLNLDRHVWVIESVTKEKVFNNQQAAVDAHLLAYVYDRYDVALPKIIDDTIYGKQQYGITIKASVQTGITGIEQTENYKNTLSKSEKDAVDQMLKDFDSQNVPAENSYSINEALELTDPVPGI